jgi:hypothetical protein
MPPEEPDRWRKRQLEQRLATELAAAQEAYRIAIARFRDCDESPEEYERTSAGLNEALERWKAFLINGSWPEGY